MSREVWAEVGEDRRERTNTEVFFAGAISTHCAGDCRKTTLAQRVNQERDVWVYRSLALSSLYCVLPCKKETRPARSCLRSFPLMNAPRAANSELSGIQICPKGRTLLVMGKVRVTAIVVRSCVI